MAQISKKIIEEIEDKQLRPKPRSYFVIFNIVLWLLVSFFIIFDGILFCIMAYGLSALDWSSSAFFYQNFNMVMRDNLPQLWLSLSFVAVSFSYLLLRQTDLGYKYRRRWTAIIVLFIALFTGILLFLTGSSPVMIDFFSNTDRPY